jgi:hypothetical protein
MVRASNAKKINDSRLLRIQLPGNPCCIGLSGEFEKFRATFKYYELGEGPFCLGLRSFSAHDPAIYLSVSSQSLKNDFLSVTEKTEVL